MWATEWFMKAQIEHLEQENRKLKESLDIATKCSSKEEDWIIRLSKENRKLKEENWQLEDSVKWYEKEEDRLVKENRKLIENEKYRYSRCMKAERKLTAFENEDLTEDL